MRPASVKAVAQKAQRSPIAVFTYKYVVFRFLPQTKQVRTSPHLCPSPSVAPSPSSSRAPPSLSFHRTPSLPVVLPLLPSAGRRATASCRATAARGMAAWVAWATVACGAAAQVAWSHGGERAEAAWCARAGCLLPLLLRCRSGSTAQIRRQRAASTSGDGGSGGAGKIEVMAPPYPLPHSLSPSLLAPLPHSLFPSSLFPYREVDLGGRGRSCPSPAAAGPWLSDAGPTGSGVKRWRQSDPGTTTATMRRSRRH